MFEGDAVLVKEALHVLALPLAHVSFASCGVGAL
jgi:hypothetical protein